MSVKILSATLGEQENHDAFVSHFTREVGQYGHVAVVNLVDQVGKEKSLSDAFLHHIVSYNDENLIYIAFDFHEYCRGMRFENVSILVDNIKDVVKDIRYCWVDKKGLICGQAGVFRVNCVDCLDRTNVVQSAIARVILETQCRKLGLLPPDEELPVKFRFLYQQMWANNGDAISRQYAGTAALKGDFTRTGERKFTGLMKDGVNSANRYYRNQFKDIYRQATIDLMMGVTSSEELQLVVANSGGAGVVARGDGLDEEDFVLVEKEENIKTLIDEWKKMLISEPETCLGSWGLIDCDPVTGDPTQQDMDIILLLSQRAYYVASYDDEIDTVTSYQKIHLEQLEKIEIGPAPSIFKSRHVCIRIWYRHDGEPGYFHMLRTTSTRLFNNIVIAIKNEEEARESLRAVCESFSAAQKLMDLDLVIVDNKLDRKKSKPAPNVINVASQVQTSTWSRWSPLSREVSSLSSGGVSPFDRIKPPPGLNMAKLGRTFADLNPMRKVKLSRFRAPRMPGFVPAVWYSKENKNDNDPLEEKNNSLERARILKGERIMSRDEVFDRDGVVSGADSEQLMSLSTKYEQLRELDAVLSEDMVDGDLGLQASDSDADVILSSCGILATSSSQVLSSILKDRQRAQSVDVLYRMRRASRKEKGAESAGSADEGKPENPKPMKARSVDLVETRRKRHHSSADLYDKKRNDVVAPLEEMIFDGKVSVRKFPEAAGAVEYPTGVHRVNPFNPPGSDVSDGGVSSKGPTNRPVADNKVHFTINSTLPEEEAEVNGAVLVDLPSTTTTTTTTKPGAQIMDTMPGLTPNDEIKDFTSRPLPAGAENEPAGGEQRPRHPKVQMIHPSMKLSFSDTSLSTTFHDMEQLDVDLKQSESSSLTSSFSKLRVKMSSLAIPTMASTQTKRSQAQTLAMENKYLSELRFKECKTKIILL